MKLSKEKKVTVNVTMSRDLFERFVETTDKKGMSRSSYISMSVSNQMAADKTLEDLPKTIEALKRLQSQSEKRKEKQAEKNT
jgi:hypothetical protein